MAKTEIVSDRTAFSKTYDLENGQKQIDISSGVLHYFDQGQYKDIDLSFDVTSKVTEALYILEIDSGRIGFQYTSKASGEVWTCRLHAVDGVLVSSLPLVVSPTTQGQEVIWSECLEGVTILIRSQPFGASVIKRLASDKAPRSFTWLVERPSNAVGVNISNLAGRDNVDYTKVGDRGQIEQRSFPLELTLDTKPISDDGTRTVEEITEAWTGQIIKSTGPATDVVYPVEFDPSFTEVIGANGDDGRESPVGTWNSTDATGINVGNYYGTTFHGGFRFSAVGDGSGPATGDTISSATLILTSSFHGGGATADDWDIYADNVDSAAAWGAASYPTNITNTIAKVDYNATGGGTINIDVTTVVQEIICRAGWTQGQAMRLAVLNQAGSNAYDAIYPVESASQEAQLSITYSAGGGCGGGAVNTRAWTHGVQVGMGLRMSL